MNIDLSATWQEASTVTLRGHAAVVIDVLRATSTIVTAIQSGAREVIPVETPEDARLAAQEPRADRVVLGGERGGLKIEGFDFGNSPYEYTPRSVGGRTVIMTTTNGTRAFAAARGANITVAAALLNVGSVADFLLREGRDVVIICAGTEGRVSLDDLYCAGALIERILTPGADWVLNDGARLAVHWYGTNTGTSVDVLASCAHGRKLAELGFHRDVEYCSRVDTVMEVPVLRGRSLVSR
ncbi:MAG: putative 2-phosphosulfolactate phosphatase [Candidatus Latescibacteria bacterium ADurb.Bin168]|nr:MAG: putative 2-phosphosulfolactate phosphatase [Candidatus Latescibacteria bacterium ADurb.Bin168]